MQTSIKGFIRQRIVKRHRIAKARLALERHALALMHRPSKRKHGRILCYHTVGEPRYGVNDVSLERFQRHIEIALRDGYRFVPAVQIACNGGDEKDLAISFDDGCASVYECAAPLLRRYGIPWSFFVVSRWCEKAGAEPSCGTMTWRQVAELAGNGAELGSHSATHPDFGTLNPARFEDELLGSRLLIEKRVGVPVRSFAIPFGQSKNWTAESGIAARKAGYDVCYAQAEETRPEGTIARTFVTAFDNDRIFRSLLVGAFDRWEEWY